MEETIRNMQFEQCNTACFCFVSCRMNAKMSFLLLGVTAVRMFLFSSLYLCSHLLKDASLYLYKCQGSQCFFLFCLFLSLLLCYIYVIVFKCVLIIYNFTHTKFLAGEFGFFV